MTVPLTAVTVWKLGSSFDCHSSVILFDKSIYQLYARCCPHRPALCLPERVEAVIRVDIRPTVCSQDCAVEFSMEVAHACCV